MEKEDASSIRTALPIRTEPRRFEHVLLHLYAPDERWDMIIRDLPPAPRTRAIAAGCSSEEVRTPRDSSFDRASAPCRRLVLEDHDRFYAPQYLAAVASAVHPRRHGLQLDPPAEVFAGDNGVVTVVSTQGVNRGHVTTAFRVRPRGQPPHRARPEDFVTAAVNRMKDLTAFSAPTNAGRRL